MIKKYIYTLFFTFSVFAIGNAQSFTITPADTSYLSQAVNSESDLPTLLIRIHNITGGALNFTWGNNDVTGPHAWEYSVCDLNNCYPFSYDQHSFFLAAGDSGIMRCDVAHYCTTGSGYLQLLVWLDGDSANSVRSLKYSFDIDATNCTNGISETGNENSVRLFPNPVRNSFVVADLSNAEKLSFRVYDLTGRLVNTETKMKSSSEVEIIMDEPNSGVYLLKIFDAKNLLVATKRFSKAE